MPTEPGGGAVKGLTTSGGTFFTASLTWPSRGRRASLEMLRHFKQLNSFGRIDPPPCPPTWIMFEIEYYPVAQKDVLIITRKYIFSTNQRSCYISFAHHTYILQLAYNYETYLTHCCYFSLPITNVLKGYIKRAGYL